MYKYKTDRRIPADASAERRSATTTLAARLLSVAPFKNE
jgi:hypothetical protein